MIFSPEVIGIAPRGFAAAFRLNVSQYDVDFVIPRLDRDLPLCIDPFLLYRSRREELRQAHMLLLSLFDEAFRAFREGDRDRAARLVDFPEARAIRFGYASNSDEGRGIGKSMGGIFVAALAQSPALVARGFKHVEELQLLAEHIGPDRVSDLAGNVLRGFLANYTREQAELWGVPLTTGVPLEHVWDPVEGEWGDGYANLPVDPQGGRPILLVPRWIVRQLPWINYQDYRRNELQAFLRPRNRSRKFTVTKPDAVEVSRKNLGLVDKYVARKEREGSRARPTDALEQAPFSAEPLIKDLKELVPGKPDAVKYQNLMLRILNTLFEPSLLDGKPQSRTAHGTEIRDLLYTNSLDHPWLEALQRDCRNYVLVFECKNVASVGIDDVNQLATYLGDPTGYLGCLLTRNPPSAGIRAKVRAVYNKQVPRRTILTLIDDDLVKMLKLKESGVEPLSEMQRLHRRLLEEMD